MSYRRPIRTCRECGRDRVHRAKGLCSTCYYRPRPRFDAPTGNPGGAGVSRAPDAVEDRIEVYARIREDRRVTRIEAARRLGISYRTAERYDARLREMETAR